ncbi:MAG: glycosyltransferase family 2 protein [Rhodospirillales bacterium]
MAPSYSPVLDNKPNLGVVVPVRNEVLNVEPLISEIVDALKNAETFEIIFVDDGSDDETLNALAALMNVHKMLRVLHHEKSMGQSAAIATGVKAARAINIITLDGDGQNDPADIPLLLEKFGEVDKGPTDFLLVTGHRTKRRDTIIKRFSSRFANTIRSGLLNDRTPDTGCGLKVFTRAAFLDMPRFDHMHRFLPALMIRRGGRVVSVLVNHRPRESGISNYGLFDRLWVGISDLIGVILRRASSPVVEEIEADSNS